MSFLEELVEAHVQEDSGFEKLEEYRVSLRPPPPPTPPASPLPAGVNGRSTWRNRRSTNEHLRDKERDADWTQLWIVALYLGIDDLYDVSDLQTWADELEAPSLIANALTNKFSSLDTREQQIALILRIRDAWGVDFYRRLRLLEHPTFLSRTPSHGFLAQLAKLAGTQSFADFSATFPSWLVQSIRNSNTPVAGLTLHERGERQVGRADLAEYLVFLNTREASRDEAIHRCPRVTFNRSNSKRRKTARADTEQALASHSPSPVENPRRAPLEPVEELTEVDDEPADVLRLDENPPPPYSPTSDSLLPGGEPQIDEELGISGIDFEGDTSGLSGDGDHMSDRRPRTASSRNEQSTQELDDALTEEAVQSAGAVNLHERVRRRTIALKALAEGTRHVDNAEKQVFRVERDILALLNIGKDCEDISVALSDAITCEENELETIQKTHAALQTLRETFETSGITASSNPLSLWHLNQEGLFQDTPEYTNKVDLARTRLAALDKQRELLKEAVFANHTASEQLASAKRATKAANKEYQDFVETVLALGEVDDPAVLDRALKHL